MASLRSIVTKFQAAAVPTSLTVVNPFMSILPSGSKAHRKARAWEFVNICAKLPGEIVILHMAIDKSGRDRSLGEIDDPGSGGSCHLLIHLCNFSVFDQDLDRTLRPFGLSVPGIPAEEDDGHLVGIRNQNRRFFHSVHISLLFINMLSPRHINFMVFPVSGIFCHRIHGLE